MDKWTIVEGGVGVVFVGERETLLGADVVVGKDSSIGCNGCVIR